MHYIVNIDNVV